MAELLDIENRRWNTATLRQLFSNEETNLIQGIPYLLVDCEEKVWWTEGKDAKFLVDSAYASINREGQVDDDVWGLIWRSNLHERLKLFLWRMASDVQPLNFIMSNRIGGGDGFCGLCGQETE